ncbi:hypothetical protein AVEN_194775-1 [Araneus ventricosus]|uniref:Uncharacterized protein n=1 Tax=Araneus ventricosus TaxID=182803 RepID=A0A4Y2B2V0_ARAVE|nr:hypothetical protein AVEN_194775-1 [Araneus ventricosus]
MAFAITKPLETTGKKRIWEEGTGECPDAILKPAFHLYSIPSICTNTVFFPPIQVEKLGTSIHLKFQSALAVGESDLLSSSTADFR